MNGGSAQSSGVLGLAARLRTASWSVAAVVTGLGLLVLLGLGVDTGFVKTLFLLVATIVLVLVAVLLSTARTLGRTDLDRRRAEEERSRAFEELRHNQQKLGLALSAAKMATWEWDLSTGLIARSPEFDQIHGFVARREKWEAKWAFSLAPPEDRQWLEETIFRHVAEGRDFDVEHRILWPDGTVRWVQVFGKARSQRGRAAVIYGVICDVTDRKEAELAAQAELRRAVAVRDEFLDVASHELRTPLTALKLQLDSIRRLTARDTIDWGGNVARKVDASIQQADRLAHLIDGLLDVSRIAMGRFRLDLEDFDLAGLVREVAGRFEADAQAAGSTIRVVAPDAVPGRWDRPRLEEVITSLLSNALKYSPGKPIDVTLQAPPGRVLLTVRDRGIGIAEGDLARIFERFERAAPSDHYGGLGLGLYVAHRTVTAHGGTITVDSKPEEGATFTVSLPRSTEPAED